MACQRARSALGRRKLAQLEKGEHHWYVCLTTSFAQKMLLEGTGEQAVLDLSLANYVLLCQESNNPIQLSGH